MATTSGLINSTIFDVTTIIEKAVRKCGALPGSVSAEILLDIQSELSLMLASLVNEGVPLWTVTKQIYGLRQNQNLLQFTSGTVDIQNIMYRFNVLPSGGTPASSAGGDAANAFDQNVITSCTQSAPNGNISYQFPTTTTVVVTVGILMHSTGILNPTYEYSNDGVTWVTSVPAAASASSFTAGQWYWQDVSAPVSALFFRVRETSGGTLDLIEVVFGTKANEILISRLNKDDYQNLPFKNEAGRPLQYWFDRQITPQIWLWPASQYDFNSLAVWRRRELQDVGSFTDILEFPNRWLDAIVTDLAQRSILIIPGADLQRFPILQQNAAKAKMLAWTEERDNSPIFITPMVSGYTRSR